MSENYQESVVVERNGRFYAVPVEEYRLERAAAQAQAKKRASNSSFYEMLRRMRETHDRKQHDYAAEGNPFSNFEDAARVANVSVDEVFAVLIGTKLARINELVRSNKQPKNESLLDSYLDLAVYAALRAAYALEASGWGTEEKVRKEWRESQGTTWNKGDAPTYQERLKEIADAVHEARAGKVEKMGAVLG
jgi:hypothetical protein